MSINVYESYLYNSPSREVSAFVTGNEFGQLARVVNKVFPRQLAASFWNLVANDESTLSWVNGNRGSGVGFVIVRDEDLKIGIDRKTVFRSGSIFPQLALTDSNNRPTKKPIQQLTFQTGNMAMDGFTFPADVVVDRSSRIIAAHYELVSLGRLGGIHVERKNSIGLKGFQDGELACFIEGSYSKEATQRMKEAIADISLYRALGSVS